MQFTGTELLTIRSALRATGEHELAAKIEQVAKAGDLVIDPRIQVHGWLIEDRPDGRHLVWRGQGPPPADQLIGRTK